MNTNEKKDRKKALLGASQEIAARVSRAESSAATGCPFFLSTPLTSPGLPTFNINEKQFH